MPVGQNVERKSLKSLVNQIFLGMNSGGTVNSKRFCAILNTKLGYSRSAGGARGADGEGHWWRGNGDSGRCYLAPLHTAVGRYSDTRSARMGSVLRLK